MRAIKDFFSSFLLLELLKGMKLTGRYMFARKITVQYPEEKTPLSPRFRGLHAQRRRPDQAAGHAAAAGLSLIHI